MPQVIYSFQEFADAMDCRYIKDGHYYLFENGAHSDGENNHYPPDDLSPEELLSRKITVANALHDRYKKAAKDFVIAYEQRYEYNWNTKDLGHKPTYRELRDKGFMSPNESEWTNTGQNPFPHTRYLKSLEQKYAHQLTKLQAEFNDLPSQVAKREGKASRNAALRAVESEHQDIVRGLQNLLHERENE